jgi:hypothetical protein
MDVIMEERRVRILGEIVSESDSMWLFSDGLNEAWFPKVQCHWNADTHELDMPEWMAIANDMI